MPATGSELPIMSPTVLAVEPHRSFGEDATGDWYGGDDWEGGRHGQPRSVSDTPGHRPSGGYGAGRFGDGDQYGAADGGVIGPRSGEPLPPLHGGDPGGDPGRRPVEAIDVGALRRQPPEVVPAAGGGVDPAGFGGPTALYERPAGAFGAPPTPDYGAAYGPGGPSAPPAGFGGTPAPAPIGLGAPATESGFGSSAAEPHYTSGPAQSQGNPPHGTTYGGPTAETGVYQGRRNTTAIAVVVAAAVLIFEIPALRVLFASSFSDTVVVSGTVAGTFLVAGLPSFGYGVYALLSGAGRGATTPAAWLRAPLVYLPVGLILLLCAALATG
jgi:hypothetical protein